MARAAEPRKPECEDLTDPQLPPPAEIRSVVGIQLAVAAAAAAGKETVEDKVEGLGSTALGSSLCTEERLRASEYCRARGTMEVASGP